MPASKDGGGATFAVHIKITGDWTEQLKVLLMNSCTAADKRLSRVGDSCIINIDVDADRTGQGERLPIIRVEGPYGSPNEVRFNINFLNVQLGLYRKILKLSVVESNKFELNLRLLIFSVDISDIP